MKTNTLARQVERLLEVRRENHRLRLQGRIDPDAEPQTATECGGWIAIRWRSCGRVNHMYDVEVATGRIYRVLYGERAECLGTVAAEIRRVRRHNARFRRRGAVEWAERCRLDAMVRRHYTGYMQTWWWLVQVVDGGFTPKFRTPRTANARKEVAELRRRLRAYKATV